MTEQFRQYYQEQIDLLIHQYEELLHNHLQITRRIREMHKDNELDYLFNTNLADIYLQGIYLRNIRRKGGIPIPDRFVPFDFMCPICADNNIDDEVLTTSCGHLFHKKCLSEWSAIQQNCPICRSRLFGKKKKQQKKR
jgi:hypothetical protein